MTLRKRRQPTPGFRLPPPYHPITGERAPLKTEGVSPYCAMMQVAAEDEHEDYVICRGFDTRMRKFIDYEEGNENKPGIPVAKPFACRVTYQYGIGQVYPALLPLQIPIPSPSDVNWRVGQNPGVSATTAGHPADLDEEVEILYDDNGTVINWMLFDTGPAVRHFELKEALDPGDNATAYGRKYVDGSWTTSTDADDEFQVYDIQGEFRGRKKDKYAGDHTQGSRGRAVWTPDRGVFEITHLTPHALLIQGALTDAATADANFSIENVIVLNPVGAIITDSDPAGSINVTNVFGHWGSDENLVVAAWDEKNTRWIGLQMECG